MTAFAQTLRLLAAIGAVSLGRIVRSEKQARAALTAAEVQRNMAEVQRNLADAQRGALRQRSWLDESAQCSIGFRK